MSLVSQRGNSVLRLALVAVFLLLGLGQALGICHSGNAHIRCCAKQQAQYKSNGKLKRIICEKCDSGYTPSKNKEQCNSIVGGTCSKGKGPTPGYLGPQKCVRCTDANCKACPNLFTECTQCKKGYGVLNGVCSKLLM